MREQMTLLEALASAPTYRLAMASTAAIASEDDVLLWAAHFLPLAPTLADAEKASLWHAMQRAGANVGLEDRDVRSIVDEVRARGQRQQEEVSHG